MGQTEKSWRVTIQAPDVLRSFRRNAGCRASESAAVPGARAARGGGAAFRRFPGAPSGNAKLALSRRWYRLSSPAVPLTRRLSQTVRRSPNHGWLKHGRRAAITREGLSAAGDGPKYAGGGFIYTIASSVSIGVALREDGHVVETCHDGRRGGSRVSR